ncbi:unnamed protein product [Amoebophrya sp. A120]|nr:unnamed protein product [Amoebophrya sp. A120]|eukprot:GSA120T00015645001.1
MEADDQDTEMDPAQLSGEEEGNGSENDNEAEDDNESENESDNGSEANTSSDEEDNNDNSDDSQQENDGSGEESEGSSVKRKKRSPLYPLNDDVSEVGQAKLAKMKKIVGLFENVVKSQYPGTCFETGKPSKKPKAWQEAIMKEVRLLDSEQINMKTNRHGSLLHLAAKHNFPGLCSYLLVERNDFYEFAARDEHGRTAIHAACLGRKKTETHRMNYFRDDERMVSGPALVPLLKDERMRALAHAACNKGRTPLVELFEAANSVLERKLLTGRRALHANCLIFAKFMRRLQKECLLRRENLCHESAFMPFGQEKCVCDGAFLPTGYGQRKDDLADDCRPSHGSFPWCHLADYGAQYALEVWFKCELGAVPTPVPVARQVFLQVSFRLCWDNPRALRYGTAKPDAMTCYPLLSCFLHSLDGGARRFLLSEEILEQCSYFCPGYFRIKNDLLQIAYAPTILCLRKSLNLPDLVISLVKEYLGFDRENIARDEKRLLKLEKKKEEDRTDEEKTQFRVLCSRLLDSEEVIEKKQELLKLIFKLKPQPLGGWPRPKPAPVPDRVIELARELFGDKWMEKPYRTIHESHEHCSSWWSTSHYAIIDPQVCQIPGVILRTMRQLKDDYSSFGAGSESRKCEIWPDDIDCGQM